MDERPTVLVLMGGPDAERAVSLDSGREVAEALRCSGRYEVLERVIDTPGAEEIRSMGGDVVFPVLHGHWGEGGPLQEALQSLPVPYVGSGPEAAALAMDKLATKEALAGEGVATPPACLLRPGESCDLDPPLVLKPVDDGSSVDLRICQTAEQVAAGRAELHRTRPHLMAEAYIDGRELTVGIIGGEPLPLIEIIPAVEFYDYQAKYTRLDTRYVLEPALPDGVAERCAAWARLAFATLGCRDLARVDFMLDERGPWFLEINTMPGFTTHSLVPMAAQHTGIQMPDLCATLVEEALRRARGRPLVRASRP